MGYVYFIQSGKQDKFKVGKTARTIQQRLKELQTGNPETLTIFFAIETKEADKVESWFHCKLKLHKIRTAQNEEWFEIDSDTLQDSITEFLERENYGEASKTGFDYTASQIEGFYTNYVRQVCGGQQNTVASRKQNVFSGKQQGIMPSGNKSIIVSQCAEFNIGCETDWRQRIQKFGKRLARIYSDTTNIDSVD